VCLASAATGQPPADALAAGWRCPTCEVRAARGHELLLCNMCKRPAGQRSGNRMLLAMHADEPHALAVHKVCADYNSGHGNFPYEPRVLWREFWRGRQLKCALCSKSGATAGCALSACDQSYHVQCALEHPERVTFCSAVRACSTASPAAFRTAGRSSCRRLRRRRPLRREPLRPRVACLLRTSRTAAAARVPSGDARASLPPAKSATRSAAGRPSLTLRVGPQQAAGLTACRMSRRSSKAWNSHGDLAPCDPRKRKLDRTRHQRRSRRRARSCSRCIKSVQVPPQLCGERRMRRVSAPAAKQQALMMKQTCDEAD
jgi:hypothetical protein